MHGLNAIDARLADMNRRASRIRVEVLKQAIAPADFYREELGIMQISRTRCGWMIGGICPFHNDRRPGSFKFNTLSGAFKCFSCGASGGDILAFVMQRDDVSFPEALEGLASDWGVVTWQ